jgi:hypothetical protein
MILLVGGAAACSGADSPFGGGADDASALYFFPQDLAAPIKVLSQTDDDVVAVVSAGAPHLRDVTLAGAPYKELRLEGFASSGTAAGSPEVPHVDVLVAVPRGATLRYEILERDADPASTLERDLAFTWRLPFHTAAPVYAERDAAAYARAYGEQPVAILDESWAGREKLATIRFFPAYYDAAARRLQITRHLKVHFWFDRGMSLTDGALGDEPPVAGDGPSIYSSLALNAETATRVTPGSYATKLDLLVVHESLKGAIARYVAFKQQRGRQVKEVYVSGKTAQQIKELIKAEYKSATPPTHTLLVGNITMIPSFRGDGDNSWTDYSYQALDNGNKPDVSLGRVPAHTEAELGAWIDKAIARETQPRNVNEILLTAGNDVGMGCPSNVAAVGDKIKGGGSQVNLVRKFMSEGAGQSDVISAYNGNPNVVVYDGHGYQQGMSEIPLLIKDLPKLKNTVPSIILDIACLNANWSGGADARNFAESILLMPGAGAAGIMASGGSGYGHDYFRTIGEIMASARSSGTDAQMNEIGQVILAAKLRHEMQDRSYWNYYGDPASSVWESAPATGTGGAQPGGTQPPPVGDTGASTIKAALGAGDASVVLFGSIDGASQGMSYCLGAKADCIKAGASWLGMTKVRSDAAMEIHAARAPLAATPGLRITVFAKAADGREVIQEIALNQR